MNRYCVAVCLVAIFLTVQGSWAADTLVLVEGGVSEYAIVLPKDVPDRVDEAAGELHHFLKRITGVTLPVVEEGSGRTGPGIYLGATERAARAGVEVAQGSFPTPERYVLKTDGQDLLLLGNDAWCNVGGTSYAVFDLLERFGCRWFMPGELGEVVPEVSRLAVESLDVDVTPALWDRGGVWYEYHAENSDEAHGTLGAWRYRNRIGARWIPTGHHMKRIMPPERHFERHPEWYPLINGKRQPEGAEGRMWHPCVSNEELRGFVADNLLAQFRASSDRRGLSLALNDAGWQGWCQCEACKAMGAEEESYRGSQYTNRYLAFVNDVAKQVISQFPERLVTCSAYASTQVPPREMAPLAQNVFIVIMHYYWADQSKPLQDDPFYSDVFDGFARLTPGRLGIYEYYGDFHYDQLPVPAWSFMDEEFEFWLKHGVKMLTIEGGNHWAANGLTYYVAAKKSLDPSLKSSDIVDDYCERFFGPAAAPMRRYFDLQVAPFRAAEKNERNGRKIRYDTILDDLQECLDKARALATEEPYAGRVAFYERYQDYLNRYYKTKLALEAAQPEQPDDVAAAAKLVDDFAAYLDGLPEDGMIALPSAKHFTLGWMRKALEAKVEAGSKK